MFEIFSTREIATLVWFAALIVYVTVRSNGKMPFRDFLKALCNKLFIIPVLCLLGYAALIVYGLSQFSFWDWILIKDVIIWVLFVATPVCFKAAVNRKKNQYPFKRMVIDNFVWSALLEFFIGAFTFTFVAEMFVVPTFSLIVLLQNHDRENEKYRGAHKLIDGISVITGFLLLVFTIDKAINVIAQDGIVDVLILHTNNFLCCFFAGGIFSRAERLIS